MQDKQKVTLYLPPELHRQLKIRAAVDAEPMSEIAERAIGFYLHHQEIVDQIECSQGGTAPSGDVHRIYNCPACESSLVVRSGEMVQLQGQPGLILDDLDESLGLVPGKLPADKLVGARS
jgi:hypothetical protein